MRTINLPVNYISSFGVEQFFGQIAKSSQTEKSFQIEKLSQTDSCCAYFLIAHVCIFAYPLSKVLNLSYAVFSSELGHFSVDAFSQIYISFT